MTGAALDHLLALQHLDTDGDQLRHQRANLRERAALAADEARLREVRRTLSDLGARRTALAERQAGLERTIRDLDARAADLAAKLPRTMVVKEAEALLAEQRVVRQSRSDVEDEELVLLEEDEGLDNEEVGAHGQLAEQEAAAHAAREALAGAEAVLDAQLDDLERRRSAAAAAVPPDLLARYGELRKRFDGVAVAELIDGRCSGCHLALASAALERIANAPPDALVECEECGRLLVR